MTLYGVTVVRDEADIIEQSIRHHLAEGCDKVLVIDHGSTDGTSDILAALADELPVEVTRDDRRGHHQAQRITRLARQAAEQGADWVLPFDADEFFYSDDGPLCDVLESCPPQMGVLACQGFDHIARTEGLSPWRRPEPQRYPKVIFRAHPDVEVHEGNHGVNHPLPAGEGPVRYRHFQYRSEAHYRRKVTDGAAQADAAGQAPEYAAHWREAAALSEHELMARWIMLSATPGLVFDPAPIRRPVSVSIIIPTLDRSDLLDRCLGSLQAVAAEVLVERDSDRTGFAATCNRGAKEATGEVLVFLNDDTIVQPGWLDALTRRVGWGVVGGLLTYPDGRVQHSGVFLRRRGVLEAFNRQTAASSGEVPAVTGACLAVRRDLWDDLGGFDEGFRNGYEDVDLCLRAREAGERVFLAADCRVTHLESQSDQAERFGSARQNIALLNERWGDLEV